MCDLKGKRAFVAGVADDQGYGWAIAKALADAGCEIILGTWPPVLGIFKRSLESGRVAKSFEIAKIYPLDAAFDHPDHVPAEIRENKRYKDLDGYTISEVAKMVEADFGKIDILVHCLANAPEAKSSLLETSREGYLAASSASAYSHVSMIQKFGPLMNAGGASLTMSYIAAEAVVPGYGGGLNAAKASLESDVRTLAWEAGRKWGVRVNAISAGPLGSRAAKAIGFIDRMISYSEENSPLKKTLSADEVGNAALFLLSPMASAITGEVLHVDNGLHAMAVGMDSRCLS